MVVRGSAWEAASCTSRKGTPASSAAVVNACRSVCGPIALAIPARRATPRTIRPAPRRSSRRPSVARKIERSDDDVSLFILYEFEVHARLADADLGGEEVVEIAERIEEQEAAVPGTGEGEE